MRVLRHLLRVLFVKQFQQWQNDPGSICLPGICACSTLRDLRLSLLWRNEKIIYININKVFKSGYNLTYINILNSTRNKEGLGGTLAVEDGYLRLYWNKNCFILNLRVTWELVQQIVEIVIIKSEKLLGSLYYKVLYIRLLKLLTS